ncbi:MAG TPA: two-component regulator propeller domain-containing protein [Mucilaginibacter sp.]|jgi:signal transduction histidine kinase/ligand-binding sensor domain-containing protein/DNA-binding NarL/FixJ family response regulator
MKEVLLRISRYVVFFAILLSAKNVFGYQPTKYLGIEQGLSNNAVTSIYKDNHGFVWIGTYDGLNRYDGSAIKIFRNVWGDPQSLNDNHVNKITGSGNKIFAGTQRGLVYYNYNDSRFYPMFYNTSGSNSPQKITNNITALQADAKGNVFIGTDYAGLFIYQKNEALSNQIAVDKYNRSYSVQAITIGADNKVWVFIRDVGLCRFNLQDKKLQVINRDLKSANCLLKDAHDNIWIGTDYGLFNYQPLTNHLHKFTHTDYELTSENIVDIKFTKSGELWIGTNGGGVNVLDTAAHKISYIVSGGNSSSLHSNAISMIYEDEDARIWIATLRGGINILDKYKNQFELITHDPFNKNSLVNNFSLSFCEDELNNIWIGTDGGGLSYWNRKGNQFTNYVHSDDKASLSSNFVVSIIKDRDNQVWFATFSGGIDRFDKHQGKFIHYSCYNSVTKTVDKNLWKLYLDTHNNLWAGTTRGGPLYWYNRKTDRFEVFDGRLTNIHTIFEDHNGTLWAGDYSKLIKIDIDRKKHQFIYIKSAVRSITEDKNNNLWIGTEGGGLLKYNLLKNNLTRFTEVNGLPSNSVLNILIDNSGNLWASTYNGLTEYRISTGKFKNFYASDGLQSNQFNFNAAVKLKSGELIFGGINGFNIFFPDSIKLPVRQPQLKFTDLQINNKSVEGNAAYTGDVAIVDLKTITIPYYDATIAVNYTSLEYSFPDNISYAYYLEGWDHGWNVVGKLKTAYYSRLNEGTYTLRIKATNTAGGWDKHQLTLRIIVLPPWYRTWWAYVLYLSAIGGIIYGFWLYRIRQTRLKYEIRIANIEMEREKELNEKKLSFFTNISHEFRTPLTLIINPIKDLLGTGSSKDNAELNIIYRNARRLLGLVDHLLLFRKTESENDRLNITNINFSALCNDVYLCFSHQAKIKNIKYNFYCHNSQINIPGDREKIEIALFNLISNALKFTPEAGEINIALHETANSVILEVADNGCGITDGIGEKLFDKFYQIRDNTSLKTGFGIGLYLVKSFIKSHNGTITYKNNDRCGTTFTVELPKGDLGSLNCDERNSEFDQPLINELINNEINDIKPAEEEANNLELLISDRQSVLIVDDNAQLRGYIKKIFKENYKTYEAETGEKGLEIIKKYLPDVVISDIIMGGISGIDLCRIIKQDSSLSHIPVILLSGDPNPEMELRGIEVGAVDFVSKPFEKDLLMARVKGILKDRRELQNYFYNEITLKSNARNISEHHKDFLYKCIGIIENYLLDPDLDVKTIADEMGVSYSSLFKKIKEVSGHSVNSFVRFVRLRKAAEFMIHTNCNVNEAALNAGFNDIKYFREHFIKQFGIKPSEFIKKHRTAFYKTYQAEEFFR